jgi:hypothetical protein
VPAAQWKGVRLDKSSDVLSSVQNAADTEATIGILGAEIYDKNRNTVSSLAFRAYGQYYAYYPDSRPETTDKRNLRDGHYTVWSPTEYMYRESSPGVPVNVAAKQVVDLIMGFATTPAADFDSLKTVIQQGLVPDCAMKVTRSSDGGPLSLYSPAEPCGCFFEKTATGNSACTPCTDNSPCGGGVCRHGFCEAR